MKAFSTHTYCNTACCTATNQLQGSHTSRRGLRADGSPSKTLKPAKIPQRISTINTKVLYILPLPCLGKSRVNCSTNEPREPRRAGEENKAVLSGSPGKDGETHKERDGLMQIQITLMSREGRQNNVLLERYCTGDTLCC